MKREALVLVVAAVLFTARDVRAHHSFSPYDMANPVVIEGTVTRFEYTNPHAYLYVMTSNGEWTVEFGSTAGLRRAGILRTTFNPGDRVRVSGAPRKDGTKELAAPRLLNAAGEEIYKQPPVAPPER
jgi:hypothetical protein